MALISYTNIEDGQSADANVWNSRFGDILAQVNGNLDAQNIKNGSLTRELFSPDANLSAWPVNSVYLSVDDVNPSTKLGGGTWVMIAQGRALVGVDPNDSDFNEAEKTTGTKTVALTTAQMPSHSHGNGSLTAASAGNHTHTYARGNRLEKPIHGPGDWQHGFQDSNSNVSTSSAGAHTHNVTGSTSSAGSGQAHNNVQPSMALYVWKRVA